MGVIITGVIIGIVTLYVEYWSGLFVKKGEQQANIKNMFAQLAQVTVSKYQNTKNQVIPIFDEFKSNLYKAFLSLSIQTLMAFVVLSIFFALLVVYGNRIVLPTLENNISLVMRPISDRNDSEEQNEVEKTLRIAGLSQFLIGSTMVTVWCLSIWLFVMNDRVNKLQNQLNHLNTLPGIKDIKKRHDEQLYDKVNTGWSNFILAIREKYKSLPLASDLDTCIPLRVENEILIIGCPSSLICNRVNESGESNNYRKSIEDFLKKFFREPKSVVYEQISHEQVINYKNEWLQKNSPDVNNN